MNITKHLAASLEDAGVVITNVDDRTGAQIEIEEMDHSASDEIIESVAMIDSLEALAALARKFVDKGIASFESAELIQMTAGEILADHQFVKNIGYSFESCADANEYHERIITSLEGIASNIGSRFMGLFKTRVAQWGLFFSTGTSTLEKMNKRLGELQNYLISNFDESGINDLTFSSIGIHSFLVGGKFPATLVGGMSDSRKTLADVISVANDYDRSVESLLGLLSSSKSDEALKDAVAKLSSPVLDSPFSNHDRVPVMGNWSLKVTRSDKAVSTGWGPVSFRHRIKAVGDANLKMVTTSIKADLPIIGQIFGRKSFAAGDIKGALEATIATNTAMIAAAKDRKAKERDIGPKLAEAARKATENGISAGVINTVSQIVAELIAGKDTMLKSTLTMMGNAARLQLGVWSSITNRTKTANKPKFEEPAPDAVFGS